MHAGTRRIETDRLILRRFVLQDADSMYSGWINDPKVQFNYGEPVYGHVILVEQLLSKWIFSYEKDDYYRWAVVLKGREEECIGHIAFCSVDTEHRLADIEYCIGVAYQNKGYASEALSAVINYTFTQTGLHRLQAFHRGRNQVSGRVLQKAKMQYEGTFRQSFYYSDTDEYDDRVYYGIVKEDA